MRRNKKKIEQKSITVESARYVQDFTISLALNNGAGWKTTSMIDFLPLFQKHVKGENLKYFAPSLFKKFIVKNGNIYWGRNEDVIFPVSLLLKQDSSKEDILYII